MRHIDGWLDLCSGIGAGFPYAGIKLWERSPNYFCEWNSYCRRILATRFPGIYRIDDIRKCDFELNNPVQLITASPPCQPFSVDGKRLAANDSRNCFPDVLRAIQATRPKFAVIENVAGLLNCPYSPGDKPGTYFSYVLDSLSSIGFDAEWQSISSAHFASPWRRERLIIVAISRRLEWGGEQAAAWEEQVRDSVESIKTDSGWGSSGPGIPRAWLPTADRIHESAGEPDSPRIVASPGAAIADRPQIGVASRDGDNRDRREALGNALDWRVAAVGLRRVEYLSDLAAEHRSAGES
ncbi:DNA cytosine methyltransferase [Microcoleus sp. herbarium5]|uniref:DNA cytosine methyltransferase n=1 Tax=Microcoleus sp. herbarium5 TaxID=3055434 RepID=UPI00403F39FE